MTDAVPASEDDSHAAKSAWLPPQYALDGVIADNPISQLRRSAVTISVEPEAYDQGGVKGRLVTWGDGVSTLVVPQQIIAPAGISEVLRTPKGQLLSGESEFSATRSRTHWVTPETRDVKLVYPAEWVGLLSSVRASWHDQFSFKQERSDGVTLTQKGLRPPQIGALYATLAHWTVSDEAATIVMPTGTGKTETMLAILTSQGLERLLVVVPTAPLREQIANKFRTLGLLHRLGVLTNNAAYPVVGTLAHIPPTPLVAEAFLKCCNVVVATMQAVNACPEDIRRVLVEQCSHLFVDEAHHVPAKTWSDFHRRFSGKPIIQFTATPYRNDGKLVEGQVIFDYPLKKAQEDGYFKEINFRPVWAFSESDEAIAETAVDQLRTDVGNGLNHIVMARTVDISRATAVHEMYQRLAPEHNPLLVHSKLSSKKQREILAQLRSGQTRIVVCVNMLGEGFDLPQLKIAAMHDVHRSLPITLQFVGRFTRTHDDSIGTATAIANLADVKVEESRQTLFAEDSDWNLVIRELGTGATQRHIERIDFVQSFTDLPPEVAVQNLLPKMSSAIYRTPAEQWRPEAIADVISDEELYAGPSISHQHKVLWFVTREAEPIPWGRVKELENVVWHLYVLHWDEARQLLFIYSSNKDGFHQDLAEAVMDETTLIKGEQIYRVLAGIKRLVPNNLGLRHVVSRNIAHSSLVGSDVADGVDQVRRRAKTKSYIFGHGYEAGGRATIGCSANGRVWCHAVASDISEWVAWCHHIGDKLLDDSFDLDRILEGFVIPKPVTARPELVPLAMEWPSELLQRSEEAVLVEIDGHKDPFYEVSLDVTEHDRVGPIKFRVTTPQASADYELTFTEPRPTYAPVGPEANISIGTRVLALSDFFRQMPPKIRFEKDTYIVNDQIMQVLIADQEAFARERIQGWDWSGTDITKESQRDQKRPESIQRRVIEQLIATGDYDIVFDDDDSGEAADIVALRMTGEKLVVHLYHCKFSGGKQPGARVEDLYAVCGQAQKSVHWREDLERLFQHLKLREAKRTTDHRPSRFEKGNYQTLSNIIRRSYTLIPELKVFVVQPGLSQVAASDDQLELLGATSLFLQETFAIDFDVIGSA